MNFDMNLHFSEFLTFLNWHLNFLLFWMFDFFECLTFLNFFFTFLNCLTFHMNSWHKSSLYWIFDFLTWIFDCWLLIFVWLLFDFCFDFCLIFQNFWLLLNFYFSEIWLFWIVWLEFLTFLFELFCLTCFLLGSSVLVAFCLTFLFDLFSVWLVFCFLSDKIYPKTAPYAPLLV